MQGLKIGIDYNQAWEPTEFWERYGGDAYWPLKDAYDPENLLRFQHAVRA